MTNASKYRSELRLVVRAVTAAILSYLIAEAFALPQSYWAVVTALIIIQTSLGGTIAAGLDRFLGTLTGAGVGAVGALAGGFVDLHPIIVLVVTITPLVLLASIYPSFRMAPVTAVIVLLANPSNASPIVSALHRVGEIALGAVIGIAVSTVVFPSRAKRIGFERSAELLKLLAQVFTLHLQPPDAERRKAIDRLNDRTLAELGKVGTALQEARRERAGHTAEERVDEQMLRTLRRMRSDVAFVGRAVAVDGFNWQGPGPVLDEIARAFGSTIDALAGTLLDGGGSPDMADLDRAVAKLETTVDQGAGQSRSSVVLPFALETLRHDLGEFIEILSATPSRDGEL